LTSNPAFDGRICSRAAKTDAKLEGFEIFGSTSDIDFDTMAMRRIEEEGGGEGENTVAYEQTPTLTSTLLRRKLLGW
jgi:hypothetical protein